MLKRYSLTMLLFLMSMLCLAQGKVSLMRQKNMAKWSIPGANYSGITRIEGDRYAVVNDKEKGEGFYLFDISIDSVKGKIRDVRLQGKAVGTDADKRPTIDAEDVAYVPSRHTLFVADEASQRIVEYGLDGRRTGRELQIPPCFSVDSIYPNYGFESLAYSSHDDLLWTATEHTLKSDGRKSDASNREGCLLRLQSFSTATCKPLAWHYYRTDAPTIRKPGRSHTLGVSAIAALNDGSLLVLEREFHVSRRYLGSWVKVKIYRTDPRNRDPDGYLHKELVASFRNKLTAFRRNIANYEGMCLGPRLTDGRQSILLLSDSQDNYGNRLFHLKDYIRVMKMGSE